MICDNCKGEAATLMAQSKTPFAGDIYVCIVCEPLYQADRPDLKAAESKERLELLRSIEWYLAKLWKDCPW